MRPKPNNGGIKLSHNSRPTSRPQAWSHGTHHHLEGYLDFERRKAVYARLLDFWESKRVEEDTSRILEVGCAAGAFLHYLGPNLRENEHTFGLDPDKDVLFHAKPESVICGSALDLPFPDNTFDYIFMVSVLHHVVGSTLKECRDNWARVLLEVARICRPGGYIMITEGLAVRTKLYQWMIFTITRWLSRLRLETPILHAILPYYEGGEVLAFLTPSDISRLANSTEGVENIEYIEDPRAGKEFDRILPYYIRQVAWHRQTRILTTILGKLKYETG
jgi:SAM-dependent methyltransferase